MLTERNTEQHIKNIAHLQTSELKYTYRYMVGHAVCLPDYICYPNSPDEGNKRNFQYYKDGKKRFAFIINKNDLLFYFIPPSVADIG